VWSIPPVIPATREVEVQGLQPQTKPGQKCKKKSQSERDGVARVAELLPGQGKAPGSNPSTAKRERKCNS
jgi:hypothetical protein